MNSVILITGYKRTGKDTLFLKFPDWSEYEIYAKEQTALNFKLPKVRFAFADPLRQQTSEKLKVDIGQDKEKVVDGKTIREHMKEIASKHRAKDDAYYAKLIRKAVDTAHGNMECTCMITDWRFYVERDLFPYATTGRVYRSTVPVPPINDPTEHELGDFATDLLFISPGDWQACIAQFPQYANYRRIQ